MDGKTGRHRFTELKWNQGSFHDHACLFVMHMMRCLFVWISVLRAVNHHALASSHLAHLCGGFGFAAICHKLLARCSLTSMPFLGGGFVLHVFEPHGEVIEYYPHWMDPCVFGGLLTTIATIATPLLLLRLLTTTSGLGGVALHTLAQTQTLLDGAEIVMFYKDMGTPVQVRLQPHLDIDIYPNATHVEVSVVAVVAAVVA